MQGTTCERLVAGVSRPKTWRSPSMPGQVTVGWGAGVFDLSCVEARSPVISTSAARFDAVTIFGGARRIVLSAQDSATTLTDVCTLPGATGFGGRTLLVYDHGQQVSVFCRLPSSLPSPPVISSPALRPLENRW